MSPSAPWCCYCTTALLFSAVQKVSFFNIFFKSCSTAFQVMSKKKWGQVRGFSKKNERQSENTGSTLDCCRRKKSQKQPQSAQTIVFSSVGWIYLHLSMVMLSQPRGAEIPSVGIRPLQSAKPVLGEKRGLFQLLGECITCTQYLPAQTWAPAFTCTALPSYILRFSSNLKINSQS